MTLARRGAQVSIRRSHHVSWQGDEGDDDDDEQVNGFGPLGTHGVEMPTEMGGDEMAKYVAYSEGGGGGTAASGDGPPYPHPALDMLLQFSCHPLPPRP